MTNQELQEQRDAALARVKELEEAYDGLQEWFSEAQADRNRLREWVKELEKMGKHGDRAVLRVIALESLCAQAALGIEEALDQLGAAGRGEPIE